jgi:hypothetical protein
LPSALRRGWAGLFLLAAATAASHGAMRASFARALPPFGAFVANRHGLQDVSFVVAGARRAAADLAWIQFLQYLGETDEHDLDAGRVREGALRVMRLDPNFVEPCLYGAGILAFEPTLDRSQDAIVLLREGIAYNPSHPRLQSILAAVVYKLQSKPEAVLVELEKLAAAPGSPLLLKAILANMYKSLGRYRDASRVWLRALEGRMADGDRRRAERQIAVLADMARRHAPPPKPPNARLPVPPGQGRQGRIH